MGMFLIIISVSFMMIESNFKFSISSAADSEIVFKNLFHLDLSVYRSIIVLTVFVISFLFIIIYYTYSHNHTSAHYIYNWIILFCIF